MTGDIGRTVLSLAETELLFGDGPPDWTQGKNATPAKTSNEAIADRDLLAERPQRHARRNPSRRRASYPPRKKQSIARQDPAQSRIGAGRVAVWTDGACSGNPGPGGWGAVLIFNTHRKELLGGEAATTNNRMELMAAIKALESLPRPCVADVYTDSAYVRGGITTWLEPWKKNGWKTAHKKPVKNVALWQRLEAAATAHKVKWRSLKGHARDANNARADELAREGMRPYLKKSASGKE